MPAAQSRQKRRRRTAESRCSSPTPGDESISPGGGGGGDGGGNVRLTGVGSIRAKRRSVQMLTVVVVLFFVCWTPMYVMHTWSVFDYADAVAHVSPTAMNYVHLLAFVSSCCNPITYCFMSAKFRQGFVDAFRCGRRLGHGRRQLGRGRLDSAPGSVRHHEHHHDPVTTRSILMLTARERRVTTATTTGPSDQDVVVSHHC